jgi:hypothetical protein
VTSGFAPYTVRCGLGAEAMLTDDLDLFEMANLYPRTTGLPMTVWVSPKGGANMMRG